MQLCFIFRVIKLNRFYKGRIFTLLPSSVNTATYIFFFENGVLNSLIEALDSAELISKMAGGHEVTLIYNQSYGALDFIECALGTMGVTTRPSRLTQKAWERCPKDSLIIHVGHSHGCIQTKNAIPLIDEKLRQRIIFIGVVPGGLMPKNVLKEAEHFASRDFVPWFDMLISGTANSAPIIHLQPHPDAAFIDHTFNSPTYEKPLQDKIQETIRLHGKPI